MQIIDNLISNAVKFSPEGGEIKIFLYGKNNKDRIEIIDQGPGIKKKDHKKIFEKYSRQSTKIIDSDQQSGLGLSIVKKYVTSMHGNVWCQSEPGKGAKFIVEFDKLVESKH